MNRKGKYYVNWGNPVSGKQQYTGSRGFKRLTRGLRIQLSDRALAQHVEGLGFDSQHHKKYKIKKAWEKAELLERRCWQWTGPELCKVGRKGLEPGFIKTLFSLSRAHNKQIQQFRDTKPINTVVCLYGLAVNNPETETQPGMVAYTCHPRDWEVEAEGLSSSKPSPVT